MCRLGCSGDGLTFEKASVSLLLIVSGTLEYDSRGCNLEKVLFATINADLTRIGGADVIGMGVAKDAIIEKTVIELCNAMVRIFVAEDVTNIVSNCRYSPKDVCELQKW